MKATLVIGVAALIECIWKSASAAQRHLLWSMAFLLIVLLPLGRLLPSLYTIEVNAESSASEAARQILTPLAEERQPGTGSSAPNGSGVAFATWLTWVWVLGAGCCFARLLIGLGRLSLMRKRARVLPEGQLARLWRELAAGSRVQVLISKETRTPFTAGWPAFLVLPEEATEWDRETCRAVLIHERAHMTRHDWLIRLGVEMIGTVLWFHPLVWWAAGRLRLAQEEACDDVVLASRMAPVTYAEALSVLARRGGADRLALAMAQPSSLRQRIEALLEPGRSRRPTGRWDWGWSLLMVGLLLGVTSLTRAESEPGESDQNGSAVRMEFILLEGSEARLSGLEIPKSGFSAEEVASLEGLDRLAAPTVVTMEGNSATIEVGRNVIEHGEFVGLKITALPRVTGAGVEVELDGSWSWLANSELKQSVMGEARTGVDPQLYRRCGMLEKGEDGRTLWLLGRARVLPGIEETEAQLKAILLPRVDFQNVALSEVIEFLQKSARDARDAPDLILEPGGDNPGITLSLVNIPLSEALRYVSELAGREMEIGAGSVVIRRPQE